MAKTARFYATMFGTGVLLVSGLALLFIPGLISLIFSPGMFMPHAHCYLNDPRMLALQGVSDGLIGLAYMAISVALAYMVYVARRDIPFEWMFLAFGVFIFTCGWTHFLEVWTLWHPAYWLSGGVKALTAAASVATAIGVPPLLPRIFRLIETAKASESRKRELEKAHHELERLNRHLRELDEMKSQFFTNVSHELRTPLALILGTIERLQDAQNLEEDQREAVRGMRRNSQGLLKHVNDLLDASKLDAGKMGVKYQEFDLAEAARLISSNFASMAQDRGMEFTVTAPPSLVMQADAAKLERVLTNLLSNAFKFAPVRGKVRCGVREDGDRVVLEVADNGPGIPPEFRTAIFERFRQLDAGPTRRFGGTGLGLTITQEFVNLHGGTIEVSDSPEGGALFTVRLPRKAPQGAPVQEMEPLNALLTTNDVDAGVVPSQAHATDGPIAPDAPTVLVVEDNPEMNRLIARSLAPAYRAVCVFDAPQALEKLRASPVDLVLTDMMMPNMSGDQFVREVRKDPAFNRIPVVVVTAKADDHTRIVMLRQGAQDYLLKPFTRDELRARVGNLITAKQYREELERAYQEQEAFSYSLAHDMRGPLRSIHMFAHVLLEDHADNLNAEARDQINRIISSAQRLEQLVSDVLGYTKMSRSPLELRPVDVERLLREIIEEEPRFQPPNAQITIENEIPRVLGDASSLTQVITNLLSNGVKFVAPGVTPQIQLHAERTDGGVKLVFKDNGIGIQPKDQERVFKMFERVHSRSQYEGTGLGLAIVRKAVERMGGRIGVVSEPGQGSQFYIELRPA